MPKLTYKFFSLLSKAPQLRTLNVDNIYLPQQDLIQIGNNCPLLEELTLNECIGYYDADEGLKAVFIRCLNLKYLDIGFNKRLKGTCFEYLPPHLLYLNIGMCHRLNSEAFLHVAEKAANLETLILKFFSSKVNDMIRKLMKLRFLSITGSGFLGLDLSYLNELEVVNLHVYRGNVIHTLQSLRECPKLRALEVGNIFGVAGEFDQYIPSLKNLNALTHLSLQNFKNLDGLVDYVQNSQLKVSFSEINN